MPSFSAAPRRSSAKSVDMNMRVERAPRDGPRASAGLKRVSAAGGDPPAPSPGLGGRSAAARGFSVNAFSSPSYGGSPDARVGQRAALLYERLAEPDATGAFLQNVVRAALAGPSSSPPKAPRERKSLSSSYARAASAFAAWPPRASAARSWFSRAVSRLVRNGTERLLGELGLQGLDQVLVDRIPFSRASTSRGSAVEALSKAAPPPPARRGRGRRRRRVDAFA